MKDLKTTTKLVKSILEVDEQSRNSDSILYLRVLERVADEYGIKLDFLTVKRFLTSMNILPFPPFESVRRARQKAQQTNPELASAGRVSAMRMENEKIYRAYALGDTDDI